MIDNINPYRQDQFEKKFQQSATYQALSTDYHEILFDKYFWERPGPVTPRQQWGQNVLSTHTCFTAVPFYYLEFLTEKNPQVIYDLGCGWNIFKKYIPNIVGIGAEDPAGSFFYADQYDYVDDEFITGHQDFFESVFSINALHFIPLGKLQQRVLEFHSMIKPGGTGYLTLNFQRMFEKETSNAFDNFTLGDYDNYVRTQLHDLGLDYAVFDVELTEQNRDEYMDGNIRLVIRK
jgi:hypothetical protein